MLRRISAQYPQKEDGERGGAMERRSSFEQGKITFDFAGRRVVVDKPETIEIDLPTTPTPTPDSSEKTNSKPKSTLSQQSPLYNPYLQYQI
jgi:hypothetical protein